METITLIIILILGIYFSIKRDKRKHQEKLDEIFFGRKSLTVNEFYNKYYSHEDMPIEIVSGVIGILEEQLDVDLSRLHKEDDFSSDLSFLLKSDSMVDVAIIVALENTFNISIEDAEAENAKTIDDMIKLVQRKVSKT